MRTEIISVWYTPLDKKLTTGEVALFGILGGLMFGAKTAMMALPNIEPVSLMVMLLTVTFGKKVIFPLYVYVFLELTIHGVGLWTLSYLYIWLILAGSAWLLREMRTPLGWAILSGGFGLLFGALCTPVCLVTGGPAFALSWWLSGIPFDLLHCAGNFFMAFFLFVPLRRSLEKLKQGK